MPDPGAPGVTLLGSGEASGRGVGPKAAMLDRAAAAGLAVPVGFVVLDGRSLPGDGDPADSRSSVRALLDALGHGPVAVRSAFSVEDGGERSHAGEFHTVLGVPPDPIAVAAAVADVRRSGDAASRATAERSERSGRLRRDVMVMAQVAARHAGVAFTEATYEDDLVEVTDGLGDALVGGRVSGDHLVVPKLRRFERPGRGTPDWLGRLARLLRSVRRCFGEGDWDVEWADDGETCWLLQVRRVTSPPIRDEAFTIANHKEILPELPSTFMTSLIESASRDLLDFYRRADPTLPVDRDFVETFDGRPYLNLSLLTDLMRALGLPSRLVTDSYGGEPDVDVGWRPWRMPGRWRALSRIAISQAGAVGAADRVGREIEAIGNRPTTTFGAAVADLREAYVALVNEMGALAASLAVPVALLRRTGTLDRHLAGHRTAATEMLDDLAPLAEIAGARPDVRAAFEAGTIPHPPPDDDGGTERTQRLRDVAYVHAAWERWVERHGHRGVFESDIARPRFVEDPAPILAAVLARVGDAGHRRDRPAQGLATRAVMVATTPLWWAARRPMAARERLRWRGMQGFLACRRRLLALADAAVADGRLPERDDLWLLTVGEVRSLDEPGTTFDRAELDRRRAERAAAEARRLPDTVHRFDDLTALTGERDPSSTGDAGSWRGLPLVRGVVRGRAFRATEPPTALPDGFDPATTILVARSVDAGWTPVFGRVAAVAVEIGGELSHGSIILRELGVPSVTNVGEIGASIRDGDEIEIDGGRGHLRVVGVTTPSP